MNKKELPKGLQAKAARDKFAGEICREIEASMRALGSLPDRWKRNEAIDRCDPSAIKVDVVPGAETYPMPLATQRNDRIAGAVFDSITGLDPYVQCIADDAARAEVADAVEADLHFLAAKSGLDLPLYQALRMACNTNIALLRCRVDGSRGAFLFEECHPQDFVAYPSNLPSLAELKTVGHRVRKMLFEVRRLQQRGAYFADADFSAGERTDHPWDSAGRSDRFDRTDSSSLVDQDDEPIVLYEFETRRNWEGSMRWFRGVVAYSSQQLLDIEELPYSRFRWTEIRYEPEYGRFWPAASPTQRMQGLQIAYTDTINTVLQGAKMVCGPPLTVEGGTVTDTKIERYGPASLIHLPPGTRVGVLPLAFDGRYLVQLIPLFESIADGVSRISQVGLGQTVAGNRTATEIAGVLEGQRRGEGMYLSVVSRCVERLWSLMFEMYRLHHRVFLQRWGPALRVQDASSLRELSLRFEVTGRSGSNNPATVAQRLQMALGLAERPDSVLDRREVEKAAVNALRIPGSSKLMKADDPNEAVARGVQSALEAGLAPEQVQVAVVAALQAAQIKTAVAAPGMGGSPMPQESMPQAPVNPVSPNSAGGGFGGQQ